MEYLLVVLLFIAHLAIIKGIGKIQKILGVKSTFKRLTISAPISISLSIILIYLTDISFSTAGFLIGDPLSGIFYILILGVPITLLLSLSFLKIPEEEVENIITIGDDNPKLQLFYTWVLVGPVEEFLYRGFLQANLSTIMSGQIFTISYSTIIASLIFTSIHLVNVAAKEESISQFIKQFPVRFIVAMILGYTFQVTGSIIYPIIIHNIFDGSNFSVLFYRKKKSKQQSHSIHQ